MSANVIGETQQRFLRAILEKVPLERMSELHLFAPIRQGGTETGLAVFATWPETEAAEDAATDAGEGEPEAVTTAADVAGPDEDMAALNDSGSAEETVVEASAEAPSAPPEPEATEGELSDDADTAAEAPGESIVSEEDAVASEAGDEPEESETSEESEIDEAPEASVATADESDDSADDSSDADEADAASAEADDAGSATHSTPAEPARVRHVVYTARYRLILKGPDRGKWEFDFRDEAEAPLVTVDAVVRGVQRRVGDIAEVERMTPEQLAVAVSDTPWKTTS